MHLPLLSTLHDFLDNYCDSQKPVLLAFSGGSDSSCLLELLLTYKKNKPLNLHICHIDHGWRKESAQETEQLRVRFEKLNLPFHAIRLYPEYMQGNLEAACREERLKFFSDLTVQYGFQGVMTAHHADDLAETVLQHVFEGAPLAYMGGIMPASRIGNVTMWRPLLEVPKTAILDYLKKNKITYFEDSTNLDPRFMRARFRTSIIPQLSKEFGKEINPSLVRLAFESFELRSYLDLKIERFQKLFVNSTFGLYFDLSEEETILPIEIKFLLRRIAEQNGTFLPHPVVEEVAYHLAVNAANKQVNCGNKAIRIDRKRFFFPSVDSVNIPTSPLPLIEGKHTYGDWSVEVVKHPFSKSTTSWKQMWEGYSEVVVPQGDYFLAPVSPQDKLHTDKTIGDWWTDKSIPSFIRYFIPAIWQGDKIAHEFLTGKYTLKTEEKEGLKVKLYFKPQKLNP